MTDAPEGHWDGVYSSKPVDGVSWYEPTPAVSLELLAAAGFGPEYSLIDIGGGASALVDAALAEGCRDVTVLDLSGEALAVTRARIGARPDARFIVADVTLWQPERRYAFWHDRAAFHFLTAPEDRRAYSTALNAALDPGGVAVIATFAPDGPEKCSGLPVQRHDGSSIAKAMGPAFDLVGERRHIHTTPWGSAQSFCFATLRKR